MKNETKNETVQVESVDIRNTELLSIVKHLPVRSRIRAGAKTVACCQVCNK